MSAEVEDDLVRICQELIILEFSYALRGNEAKRSQETVIIAPRTLLVMRDVSENTQIRTKALSRLD